MKKISNVGPALCRQFEVADAALTSNMRTATAVLALLATARAETLVVTSDDGTASWAAGGASYSAMSAEVGDVISFSYNESKPST